MDQSQNQRAVEQYHRRQVSAGSGSLSGGVAESMSPNTTAQTIAKPSAQSIMKEQDMSDAAESLETTQAQAQSPDASASPSPQRAFSTAKKLDKPASPVQHPLKVYFAENDPASPEQAVTPSLAEPVDDLRLTQSPTSFGQQHGSPGASEEYRLSEGTPTAQLYERHGQEQDQYLAGQNRLSNTMSPPRGGVTQQYTTESNKINADGEDEYRLQPGRSGLQSVFGSIEQSPQNRFDPNLTHPVPQSMSPKSPRSQHLDSQRRQGSDYGSSNMQSQTNPADNYQFLGGIREVDDDQESLTTGGLAGTLRSQTKERAAYGSGGAASSGGAAASGAHFFHGSLKGSMRGSQRDAREGHEQLFEAGNLYGSIKTKHNPFASTGQQPGLAAQWSSGKSRDSEQQLSFGGGFGAGEQSLPADENNTTPPRLTRDGQKDAQERDSEDIMRQYQQADQLQDHRRSGSHDLVERMLNKVYNQSLVQMGEKACMRVALKELAILLDELNQVMCKQVVQQDIVLSDDTPTSQMRQIMDLSLSQQRSSTQRMPKQASGEIDDQEQESNDELLQALKKKSNLQLIEAIRMDSRMMHIRFTDFLSKENNIYTRLAKERERNQMLQAELHGYEMAGNSSPESRRLGQPGDHTGPNRYVNTDAANDETKVAAFPALGVQPLAYQRDTIEAESAEKAHQNAQMRTPQQNNKNSLNNQIEGLPRDSGDDLTIEQLSPGSPFQVGQSPVNQDSAAKSAPSRGQGKQDNQEQKTGSIERPDGNAEGRDPLESQTYNLAFSRDLLRQLDERDRQIRQLNEYVEAIKQEFTLYRQSSAQQLALQSSQYGTSEQQEAGKALEQAQKEREKVVALHTTIYDLKRQTAVLEDQLKHAQVQQLHHGSPNIKVQDDVDEQQRQAFAGSITSHHLRHLNSDSSSKGAGSANQSHLNSLTVQNEAARQMAHEQRSRTTDPSSQTQAHAASLHIAETQDQRVVAEQKQVIEALHQKLQLQMRLSQRLDAEERKLLLKLKDGEQQHAELQSLVADLKSQATVNSDALEKAGKVIQKLNTDYLESVQAAEALQTAHEQLKEDHRHSRRQLEENEALMKQREQEMEGKLQRLDNELNLEIKELKDSFGQYQQDTEQEKSVLKKQISGLTDEINKLIAIQTSLETKHQADQKRVNATLSQKTMEALDLHDSNLSLKIQMSTLEKQLEQDIQAKEELHMQQLLYLKNQVNDLQQQLNSKTQNRFFPNENGLNNTQSTADQDQEVIPRVNGAYLSQLSAEFQKMSAELAKVRTTLKDKSTANIDSFLSRHLDQFNAFKLSVLDNLIDWHQKTTELSRLANKYYDTLEEYKMMFIQMKQLVKQKDTMLRSMHGQFIAAQEYQQGQFGQIKDDLMACNQSVLYDFKKNNKLLELKIKVKETECGELIRYQEEFREEYVKVCQQRDESQQANQQLQRRLDELDREYAAQRKATFDYKEGLRRILEIEEGPHCHEVVPQHVEMIMDANKTQKIQITHYQEKSNELTLELENQRSLFKQKMAELEKQLDDSQNQYLQRQDEVQEEFMLKEHELEKKISELTAELENANHEVQLRERQIKKHNSKIADEVQIQIELKQQLEAVTKDKEKALDSHQAVRETYDVVEAKLRNTEELLDQKVQRVDRLEAQLKETYERVDRLEIDLSGTKQDLERKTQVYEELHEEQRRANEELIRAENQLNSVNIANANLSAELRKTSAEEARLDEESREQRQIIQQLEAQTQKDKKHIDVLEDDLRRYQDSLAYLSRQIDEEKLRNLDFAILEKEKDALADDVAAKEEEIQSLYTNYINKPRQSVSIQTDHSAMAQLQDQQIEIHNLHDQIQEHQEEIEHLKEAMRRQMSDMERLIDEKRQLEAEIEQQHAKIAALQTISTNENINLSNFNHQYNNLRKRSNSPATNQSAGIGSYGRPQNPNGKPAEETLRQILEEKDKYINNLSTELNELRIENEKLKDKLIVLELENLGTAQYGGSRTMKSSTKMKQRSTYRSNNPTQNTLADTRNIADIQNNNRLTTETQNFHNAFMFSQTRSNTGGKFGTGSYSQTNHSSSRERPQQNTTMIPYHRSNSKNARGQYSSIEESNTFRFGQKQNGLISPGQTNLAAQYKTQHISNISRSNQPTTPMLGSQNVTQRDGTMFNSQHNNTNTNSNRLDESQFYTLQQTQPLYPEEERQSNQGQNRWPSGERQEQTAGGGPVLSMMNLRSDSRGRASPSPHNTAYPEQAPDRYLPDMNAHQRRLEDDYRHAARAGSGQRDGSHGRGISPPTRDYHGAGLPPSAFQHQNPHISDHEQQPPLLHAARPAHDGLRR